MNRVGSEDILDMIMMYITADVECCLPPLPLKLQHFHLPGIPALCCPVKERHIAPQTMQFCAPLLLPSHMHTLSA